MFIKIKDFLVSHFFIQIILLSFLWMLASAMTLLFINLVEVSYQVNDHQTASIAISILGVIVFWILAGILTYVLVGLHRGRKKADNK
jgi:heme/copper-type cytochrome/quinol oxidase subunit 2